jgi:sugar lactone lactonase YvrE
MTAPAPIEILKVRNTVGEGIPWDWRRQLLWWTDIPNRTLYRYDWNLGTTRTLQTPERVGSFGFIKDSDRLIVAFASGIALYDPYSGAVDWIARPEEVAPGGADLDVLCVTSACEGLDEQALRADPHAGDVFFYRTGVRGLREPEYLP